MSGVLEVLATAALWYGALLVVCGAFVFAVLVVEGRAYRRTQATTASAVLVARAPVDLLHEDDGRWRELLAALDRAGTP